MSPSSAGAHAAPGPRPAEEAEVNHVPFKEAEGHGSLTAQSPVVAGIGGGSFPSEAICSLEEPDVRNEFAQNRGNLIALPEKVAHFAHGVEIIGPKSGRASAIASTAAGGKERIVDHVVTAVPSGSPTRVGVPRQDPEYSAASITGGVGRLEVVDHVLVRAGPEIVDPHCFGQGVPVIPAFNVDAFQDLPLGGVAGEGALNVVVVSAVACARRGLVALLPPPVLGLVDEFVEISFFQPVRLHEAHVVGFEHEAHALKIPPPAIGGLSAVIDHAPVNPVGARARNANLIEEAHAHRFVEGIGERSPVIEAFAGRQGAPLLGIFFALLVAGLEVGAVVEPEAHGAFPLIVVASVGTAESIADVVIDHPVVDDGSIPVVEKPGLASLIDSVGAVVGEAFFVVPVAGDEVIDRERFQHRGREPFIGRNAVVDEVGKVCRGIVAVGHTDGCGEGVLHRDAIAHQGTVSLSG